MVQIHYGTAGSPADFTNYETALVLENAIVTDYSTSPLVAGSRGEVALLTETATLTFERVDQVAPTPTILRRSVFPGIVVAMTACPNLSCDTCGGGGRVYLMVVDQVDGDTQNFRLMWSDDEGRSFQSALLMPPTAFIISTAQYLKVACSEEHLFLSVANLVLAVSHNSLVDTAPFTPTVVAGISLAWTFIELRSAERGIYAIDGGASVYYISDALVAEQLILNSYGVMDGPEGRKTFLFGAFTDNSNVVMRLWTNQDYRQLSTIVGQAPLTFVTEDKDARLWLATTDGKLFCGGLSGGRWREITSFAPACVTAMAWQSHSIGYLVAGSYLYQTINAGATWERQPNPAPSTIQLLALALDGAGSVYVGGGVNAGSDCLVYSELPMGALPVFARAA